MAKRVKKQSQKQQQRQSINIRIGELPKKRRRRQRRGPSAPGRQAPMRQLPPIVYQTLPQLTYYGKPDQSGGITEKPITMSSITEPVKAKKTILEDIGMVGNVEIIDVPTKRETLEELITPVSSPILETVKPTTIAEPEMPKTTITEPKPKRAYVKSGLYSRKPKPQGDVSPLTVSGFEPISEISQTVGLYDSPPKTTIASRTGSAFTEYSRISKKSGKKSLV